MTININLAILLLSDKFSGMYFLFIAIFKLDKDEATLSSYINFSTINKFFGINSSR